MWVGGSLISVSLCVSVHVSLSVFHCLSLSVSVFLSTEYNKFDTQGIDPSLDPNSLSIEDPRNPLVQRRREDAKKKSAGFRCVYMCVIERGRVSRVRN